MVRISLELQGSGRGTSIHAAGSVRRAVVRIVLVVCFEDGEGLGPRDAGVVGAFGGLDCGGDFGCWSDGAGALEGMTGKIFFPF